MGLELTDAHQHELPCDTPTQVFQPRTIKHEIFIADVTPINRETFSVRAKLTKNGKISFFDTYVIVIVHLINNDYIITTFKEKFSYV